MSYIHKTISDLKNTSPAQSEFYQAVEKVLDSLAPIAIFKSTKVIVSSLIQL